MLTELTMQNYNDINSLVNTLWDKVYHTDEFTSSFMSHIKEYGADVEKKSDDIYIISMSNKKPVLEFHTPISSSLYKACSKCDIESPLSFQYMCNLYNMTECVKNGKLYMTVQLLRNI